MNTGQKRTIRSMARLLGLLLCMVILVPPAAWAETVWGDMEARYANVPKLEHGGQQYRLKKRLTTIMLVGTDQGSETQEPLLPHRNGGQADFIVLMAIDDKAGTVDLVQIDRDTMTEITVLNVMGRVSGSRYAQICLAHGFGDGGEQSCELLKDAVVSYIKGTPVDYYCVVSLEGISALNDALGGVEVTLEEDFTRYDPEMTAGRTMVLSGDQAEIYVRERYSLGDSSNAERQLRQRAYMQAASEALSRKLDESVGIIGDLFDALEPYMVTDMSRGRILNTFQSAKDYEIRPLEGIEGEHRIGDNGFMEFIPDEDALMERIVGAFYEPAD